MSVWFIIPSKKHTHHHSNSTLINLAMIFVCWRKEPVVAWDEVWGCEVSELKEGMEISCCWLFCALKAHVRSLSYVFEGTANMWISPVYTIGQTWCSRSTCEKLLQHQNSFGPDTLMACKPLLRFLAWCLCLFFLAKNNSFPTFWGTWNRFPVTMMWREKWLEPYNMFCVLLCLMNWKCSLFCCPLCSTASTMSWVSQNRTGRDCK